MKILILLLAIYLVYKYVVPPQLLAGNETKETEKKSDSDDFVDYEEIKED